MDGEEDDEATAGMSWKAMDDDKLYTHDKTFICICTKFSREDEDKLPNDSHSFARGCCFFLLDRRRHKSDLAMPWDGQTQSSTATLSGI